MEAGGVSALERFRRGSVLAVGRGLQHSGIRISGALPCKVGEQPRYRGVGMKGQSSSLELRRQGCFSGTRLLSAQAGLQLQGEG